MFWGFEQSALDGMLGQAHALPGPLPTAPLPREPLGQGTTLSLLNHSVQQLQIPWQESF